MTWLEHSELRGGPKNHDELTAEERRKLLFEKLELSGLDSCMENKEKEGGEMGCTEAAKHKIEVTDPKPFKERLRNIPSFLLDEVKDHLNHMLVDGMIKPQ